MGGKEERAAQTEGGAQAQEASKEGYDEIRGTVQFATEMKMTDEMRTPSKADMQNAKEKESLAGLGGWISVKEQVPPMHIGILVTDGYEVVVTERDDYWWDGHLISGTDWEFIGIDFQNITHWMPLPKAPMANKLKEQR